jgi:hypothetical protein
LELIGGSINCALSQLKDLIEETILSLLELKICLTKSDLITFFGEYTLLGIQNQENLNFDDIIDRALNNLETMQTVKKVESEFEGIILGNGSNIIM